MHKPGSAAWSVDRSVSSLACPRRRLPSALDNVCHSCSNINNINNYNSTTTTTTTTTVFVQLPTSANNVALSTSGCRMPLLWHGCCCLAVGHAHTHTRLTALFRDYPPYPGGPVPERWNQSGFYWSKRQWVVVASARLYASLHLAPDR